ncbi:hypothetical protein [Streptomyces sp. NPDC058412]|uniref:hypothetical protein n=1 Tax=Streptomyces sp. NPDC058412 TaxID=3346486 RepID=UPI003657F54F
MTEATGHEGGEGHPTPRIVKIGVIVTIVASIAGLITTGVATLYSARVADDQLKQSQQAADEKKQAQAARVSYWVDIQADGMSRLHLMNRSPDPISNVKMKFTVTISPINRPKTRQASFAVNLPSVPPCSDMMFTTDNMRFYVYTDTDPRWSTPFEDLTDKVWLGLGDERLPRPPIKAIMADFNDRDGVRWRRGNGLLSRDPKDPDPEPGMFGVVSAVTPQPLKACGDQSKPAD